MHYELCLNKIICNIIVIILLLSLQKTVAQTYSNEDLKKDLAKRDFYALKVDRYIQGSARYNSQGIITLQFLENAFNGPPNVKEGVVVLVDKLLKIMIISKDNHLLPYIINETFDDRRIGKVVWLGFGATDTVRKWDIIYHVTSDDVTSIIFINKVSMEAYLYSGKLQNAK